MYLGPEINNQKKHPTIAENEFFPLSLGQKRGFSLFVLYIKRRRRGPEVKQPFHLYWWAELNVGHETVF